MAYKLLLICLPPANPFSPLITSHSLPGILCSNGIESEGEPVYAPCYMVFLSLKCLN